MYKKCPFCAEEILQEAIKCRYCGSFLSSAPAAQSANVHTPAPPSASTVVVSDAAPQPASAVARLVPSAGVQSGTVSSGDKASSGSLPRRKMLYSGSPSWRAFLKPYALTVAGGLLVPYIFYWIAGWFDASGFNRFLAIAIPLLIAVGAFVAVHLYRRSQVFRATDTSIELEHGFFSKRIDVLELWRCRDIQYRQSLVDRILGIAHIDIFTTDVTTPQVCIVGLPASRALFEELRDSIEIQRHSRNVVGMIQ